MQQRPLEQMKLKAGEKSIDFGVGEILSWPEIIVRANAALGKIYQAPPAPTSTRFFVAGVISQSAWETVLQLLQEVKPLPKNTVDDDVKPTTLSRSLEARLLKQFPFPEKMNVDTTYLRNRFSFMVAARRARQNGTPIQDIRELEAQWEKLYGPNEGLPFIDFVHERQTTVEELIQNRPGLAAALENSGFEVSDKVRLSLSLNLEIAAPGQHPSSIAGGIVDGRFEPSVADNSAIIPLN